MSLYDTIQGNNIRQRRPLTLRVSAGMRQTDDRRDDW